jgi:membrane-associated protease RseP (regulator of RpoE activity)
MVIISAGVLMNLLFAAVAFAIVVMIGRLQMPAVVGALIGNSPAARAGLQVGDRILAVNGSGIDSFEDLTHAIVLSDSDEPLVLDVLREGKLVEPKPVVLPEYKKDLRVRQVGISPGQNLRVSLPSLRPDQAGRPDELHSKDELYKLIVDGQTTQPRDLGAFSRAIMAARGSPVDIIVKRPLEPGELTDEMAVMAQPDLKTEEVKVRSRAIWMPLPYEQAEGASGSLLGLVPRLTVAFPPDPGKSFEVAGVRQGDVITRIGSIAYPNAEELRKLIVENPGKELPIEVRRTREANLGLDAFTVEFCVLNRETLIGAARENLSTALQKSEQLATAAGVPAAEREKLRVQLEKLLDAKEWRVWFENVDVHKLGPIIPKAPFALFSKPDPTLDAALVAIDEDHLVVADVQARLGEADSPAKLAGIPRGAVILSVGGQPVRQWYELCEALRQKAGQTVELAYRVVDQVAATRMAVPNCIPAALDLPQGTRVVKIDGQTSFPVRDADGKPNNINLPDWRATAGLLRPLVGKTVQVEYVTTDGERHSGEYAVTPNGTDPWLERILYGESYWCYSLLERHPVRNPILAVGIGFKRAYMATMQTIQSIRHLVITRQVGLNKISGPVGIIRYGSRIANSSVLDLLWFLAILSANLAVINFLPMPIVDGGLFLFLLLEKLRGEPVSIKTQVATQIVGIALIGALFILVTYQDIKNWIMGT